MTLVIIGATSMEQLKTNIGAKDVVLSADVLTGIARRTRNFQHRSEGRCPGSPVQKAAGADRLALHDCKAAGRATSGYPTSSKSGSL
jgi:hypothetical protein